MYENISLRIRENFAGMNWEIYGITVPEPGGPLHAVLPVELVETQNGMVQQPMCHMSQDQVQTLFDDMWLAGVRPSDRLRDHVPLDHLEEETKWCRGIIERLLP